MDSGARSSTTGNTLPADCGAETRSVLPRPATLLLHRAVLETSVIALLAFCLFFAGTADNPLIGRDEARFAQAAREMLARGEVVVPTFGGINRYHKPILVYWCTIASYAVCGVNERAARLPSNLAAAATVALLAWWARRRWGPGAGLLAGGLLAITLTFHVQAKACTADLVMVLPAVAALLALEAIACGSGRSVHALFFWLGMALAVLAKGPVAPAFALFALVGMWAVGRRWRWWEAGSLAALSLLGWWRLGPVVLSVPIAWSLLESIRDRTLGPRLIATRWWWGVPLFLLVTAPWTAAAWIATDGEFFRVAVGRHVVERSMTALESHGGFPGFYVVTGLIAVFPLFAFLPNAVAALRREAAGEPALRYRLGWLLGPLFMLELLGTKLVHYWMLAYPAAVLLVVEWATSARGERHLAGRWSRALLGLGGLVLAIVPGVLAHRLQLPELMPWAVLAGGLLTAGVVAAVVARDPRRRLVLAMAASAVYLAALMVLFLPRVGPFLAAPRAAERALELRRDDESLVVFKVRDDELFFYLPLDVVNCRSDACLARYLSSGRQTVVLARAEELERLRRERSAPPVRVAGRVRGIDLGRVEWVDLVVFRPRMPGATDVGKYR